jgi:hypothetical protein
MWVFSYVRLQQELMKNLHTSQYIGKNIDMSIRVCISITFKLPYLYCVTLVACYLSRLVIC